MNRLSAAADGRGQLRPFEPLEPLEGRDLLAPTVSFFQVTPVTVSPGQTITLQADGGAGAGIRAMSFFRDANLDGRWTQGVDEALGDAFARNTTTGFFQVSFAAPSIWGRNIRYAVDAVDNNGTWTTGALRTANGVINVVPQVTSINVTPSVSQPFQTLTISATASDDQAVRAVTFFLDRDNNGRFTPGLDSPLGDDQTPDGLGRYEITTVSDSSWPLNSRIIADAVDFDGFWSGNPRSQVVRIGNPTPPTISGLTTVVTRGVTSPVITIEVTATDNTLVRAVTFWVDFNQDGRWTPGTDMQLGTATTPKQGQPTKFALNVPSDFAGMRILPIAADAVDVDGTWSLTPATGSATAQRIYQVMYLTAENIGLGVLKLTAGAWSPAYFDQPAIDVDVVRFFYDANNNDVYDGADTDLGLSTAFSDLDVGREFTKVIAIDSTWPLPRKIGAAVPLPGNTSQEWTGAMGPTRFSKSRVFGNVPVVSSLDVVINNPSAFLTPGSTVTLNATANANNGIDVVSFYYDRDNNGRWDAGVDVDLGFVRPTAGQTSVNVSITRTITSSMLSQFGAFTAVVKDTTTPDQQSGVEPWGTSRAVGITPTHGSPAISNITSPTTIARGNPLAISFNAADFSGVRAVSAFIDGNRNNGFDTTDPNASAISLLSGTASNGRWTLTLNTTSLAAGTYTIYLAAQDFYKGSSTAPGGTTTGLWSPRVAVSITIT
jgi:archaellin